MGAVPGGELRTFCDPEYTTSTPRSSQWNGTPPSDATVSTISKQLYLTKKHVSNGRTLKNKQ